MSLKNYTVLELLTELTARTGNPVTEFYNAKTETITRAVCEVMHITPEDMLHGGRSRMIAWARVIAMILIRANVTSLSHEKVAIAVGLADHSNSVGAKTRLKAIAKRHPEIMRMMKKAEKVCNERLKNKTEPKL